MPGYYRRRGAKVAYDVASALADLHAKSILHLVHSLFLPSAPAFALLSGKLVAV